MAESTPGKISGKVTFRKVRAGLTPRLHAASSTERSKRFEDGEHHQEGEGEGVEHVRDEAGAPPRPRDADGVGDQRDAEADQHARHDHAEPDEIEDRAGAAKALAEGLRREDAEHGRVTVVAPASVSERISASAIGSGATRDGGTRPNRWRYQ